MKKFLIAAAALSFVLVPALARAACSNPAGDEGEMLYNGDYNVMQFCNGTDWIAAGAINPAAGSGTCSNPAGDEGESNRLLPPRFKQGNW
jgi:hypothetical protein